MATKATIKTAAAQPSMTFQERVGARARLALEKDFEIIRGWEAAGDPEVLAKVEAFNAREAQRCKTALLNELSI